MSTAQSPRIFGWRPSRALALLPAVLPGYLVFQVSIALTYAIAILGLNLLMGFNGQISLAQGVFFAVGGYIVAILMTRPTACRSGRRFRSRSSRRPFSALVIGIPALRLQGLQLAIITLVLAALVPPLDPAARQHHQGHRRHRASTSRNRPAWLPIVAGHLCLSCLPRRRRALRFWSCCS